MRSEAEDSGSKRVLRLSLEKCVCRHLRRVQQMQDSAMSLSDKVKFEVFLYGLCKNLLKLNKLVKNSLGLAGKTGWLCFPST